MATPHRWDMWSLQMGDFSPIWNDPNGRETPKTKVELQEKGLENDVLRFWVLHLSISQWKMMFYDVLLFGVFHWIGFVGKIYTGNPWVFTIKYIGLSG